MQTKHILQFHRMNVCLNLKCFPVIYKIGSFMAKFQDSYPPLNCTKMPLTGSPQWEEGEGQRMKKL